MRPVEMNKAGLLAAAMYAILEDRLAKGRVECFSVQTELLPGSVIDATLFGTIISGYIRVNGIHRRDFVIDFDFVTGSNTIKVEVPYKMEYCGRDRSITRLDVKEPIEINFDKRRITFKHVHTLSTKNVAWDWASVKGTALDIIGIILGEENS